MEKAIDSFIPIFLGILSYYITSKIDEYRNRKKLSKLGVAILNSLLEEVNIGIDIMVEFQNNHSFNKAFLPNKSWSGQNTINDDVLLRIIETSKKTPPVPFNQSDVRIHCKNYFEIMTEQWNENINGHKIVNEELVNKELIELILNRKYIEAANSVKTMLEQIKYLLEKNSKSILPK